MELGWTWLNEINLTSLKKPLIKRKIDKPPKIKKTRQTKEEIIKYGTTKIFCPTCRCYIQRRIKAAHSRTNKHKKFLK